MIYRVIAEDEEGYQTSVWYTLDGALNWQQHLEYERGVCATVSNS